MKIAGTPLDIPVPDGWKYQLCPGKLVLSGRQEDTEYYRDRHITIEFDLDENNRLGMWRSKAQIHEHRKRQKFTLVKVPGEFDEYKGTGKWVRSESHRKVQNMYVLMHLANGWAL